MQRKMHKAVRLRPNIQLCKVIAVGDLQTRSYVYMWRNCDPDLPPNPKRRGSVVVLVSSPLSRLDWAFSSKRIDWLLDVSHMLAGAQEQC